MTEHPAIVENPATIFALAEPCGLMSEIDPRLPAEAYLVHSEWVRRLARRLLDDTGAAEDVAQETWIAFLRQPLGTVRDLRGWLHGVTRRLALKSTRDRGTRRLQRADTEPELIAPSPADVLEVELVRKQVIESVLALDEPYRSTVLLHFYDGLSSEDIARRLGLPSSTVRTRLQRALAKLRDKLEARDVRGRDGLQSALVLVARRSGPTATTGKGIVLAASVVTKSSLVGAVLIGLGLLCWLAFHLGPDPAKPAKENAVSDSGRRLASIESGHSAANTTPTSETDRTALSSEPVKDASWHLTAARTKAVLAGTVVRSGQSMPVAGATVRIRTSTGPVARFIPLADDRVPIERSTTTSMAGAFEFDDVIAGPYALHAEFAGGLEADVIVAATEERKPVLVTLARVEQDRERIDKLFVRTIGVTGAPLPGVDLQFSYRNREGMDLSRTLRSDQKGELHCDRLDLQTGLIRARSADGLVGHVFVVPGQDEHARWLQYQGSGDESAPEFDIILGKPGSIAGVIQGGASVVVHAWCGGSFGQNPYDSRVTTASDGSFRLDDLSAGRYTMTVDAPPGLRADLPEWKWTGRSHTNDFFPRVVHVEAGVTTTISVPLVASASLRGRVTESDGKTPIAGAEVKAWIVRGSFGGPGGTKRGSRYMWSLHNSRALDFWSPADWRRAVTDADGRYVITNLDANETWALEVLATDRVRDFVEQLAIEDGKTLALEHRLERAGGIQGVAWRSANLGFQRDGEAKCCECVSLPNEFPDSTFTVAGLRPGRYTILALHWSDLDRQSPIAVVDVRAGELAWTDLRDKARGSARVRLIASGRPLSGAHVRLDCPDESLQSTSDAEGRCVFNLPFTTEEPAVLEVTRFEDARNVRTKFVVANLLDRTPGREAELEVPDAALEVRVHDGRGAPVAAAVKIEPVSYWNEGSEVAGTLTFTLAAARDTDSNGIARFAGLVPGKFKVWTTSSDGSMIPPVSVDVVAGVPGRIDVEQPPTGSLTVHVVDAQARSVRRARVDVMRKSDSVVIASFRLTDETGTATFPAIAAGDVTVSAGNDLRDLSATGYGKADGHVESGTGSTITIKMD